MTKKNIIVTILIVTISNSSLFAWSEDQNQKMKYTVDKSNFESDKRDRERNQFRNEERRRQQMSAAVEGKYFRDTTRSYNDPDGQTTEMKALKEVVKQRRRNINQRNINQANSPHHPIKNSNSEYDSNAYGTDLYQSDGYQSSGY